MSELQEGDKVRIKYWDELPNIPGDEWHPDFFEDYGGKKAVLSEILMAKVAKIEFGNGSHVHCNLDALTKLSIAPDELFEI